MYIIYMYNNKYIYTHNTHTHIYIYIIYIDIKKLLLIIQKLSFTSW